ncbi:DUF2335 domain-containing protein [Lactobacillus helveticus]|uniref:DUF2335 domain-containing protein n=1 Tax=Lactobacillus helveticus TaxID=1587 RepID=UPI0019F1036C|nr:DUF2335 domain-containing protein [Lactobacillus helveticus]NRO06358.1 hypothetical protein [Lactobacillus helveticus]
MVDPKPNNELKETKNKDDLAPLDKQIVDQIQKSGMPKETKDEIIAHLEMYRGPIPHPDILEGYQKLYPNAAKEIIDNGVDESKHRRKLETARQKRRGLLAWTSLIVVSIVTILCICISAYLIVNNHSAAGSIFGGIGVFTLFGGVVGNIDELTKNDDLTNSSDHYNQ